jgi:hypothetical protein
MCLNRQHKEQHLELKEVINFFAYIFHTNKSLKNICSDQQKNNYAQYKDGIVYYKSFFILFINTFTVVINFVSDFRLVGGFLLVLPFP